MVAVATKSTGQGTESQRCYGLISYVADHLSGKTEGTGRQMGYLSGDKEDRTRDVCMSIIFVSANIVL